VSAIVVETSSWADPGFVEHWYPEGLPARERLPYYAERFRAVELNSSFYAVPARNLVERWVEDTPDGFLFDIKLHKLLSHHAADPSSLPKDMRDDLELSARGRVVPTEELQRELAGRFLEATAPLAEAGKLGAFLLQLSPAFRPRDHRIEDLEPVLEALAPHKVAVEFRYRAWLKDKRRDDVLGYLSDRGAAFVAVDAPVGESVTIMPRFDAVTNHELAYLRCHGRNAEGYVRGRSVAERFDYDYPDDELVEIAERAHNLAEEAEQVHVAFNNNARDLAPKAARRLRELLDQDPGPEPERSTASGD
jgi:uncharacterized protein YecE (DUF72 family)